MSEATAGGATSEESAGNPKLALLLAMAMFVLVVDTSLMNVSISAVVADLQHDRERGAVGDRARGARVGRVHPDQQQGRRPDRAQAGLRARPAGVRGRRARDDARAEPDRDHHLLGDHRRPRRFAAAARDAVPDPRQLRRRRAQAGVRAGRCRGCDRRRRRAAARRLRHHLSVVARRLRARGRRDRGRAVPDQARPRRALHGAPAGRRRRSDPLRLRDGRPRARDPRLAGGRRVRRPADGDRGGRAGAPRVLARASQAGREGDAARPGPVPVPALHDRDLPADAAADHPRRRDDRAADLPADDARVQRDAGGPLARAALAEHVRCRAAGRAEGGQAAPEQHRPDRVRAEHDRDGARSSRSCLARIRAGRWSSRC